MAKRISRALFITFEGIDGCGKTTQAKLAYDFLEGLGYSVRLLREPGSTPVAEKIRSLLLDKKLEIADTTELLLYEAARHEITSREIQPALKRGEIVLCDRFYDSTTAYQGYGRKLDIIMVKKLHRIAVGRTTPDLTFVFDVNLKTASSRIGQKKDRLEAQSPSFFRRVRNGFRMIAHDEPKRVKLIDASKSALKVFEEVKKHLVQKIEP